MELFRKWRVVEDAVVLRGMPMEGRCGKRLVRKAGGMPTVLFSHAIWYAFHRHFTLCHWGSERTCNIPFVFSDSKAFLHL